MKLVLILLVVTIGLTLLLKYSVASKYGPDVAARFLERLNFVPSQMPPLLSRENLARWVGDPAQAAAKDGYAMPVLFPFDLLFMICLSALLAFASVLIVEHLRFLSGLPLWIWWLLPLGYMSADLAEDCAIFLVLRGNLPLTDAVYGLMRHLTGAKPATVSIAIGQVGFLAVLAGLVRAFPAKM